MPELKLGVNDKILFENAGRRTKRKTVDLEDVKFHQCVKLNRFESDRTIFFIPPDGKFELMTYRLNTKVKPMILVTVCGGGGRLTTWAFPSDRQACTQRPDGEAFVYACASCSSSNLPQQERKSESAYHQYTITSHKLQYTS